MRYGRSGRRAGQCEATAIPDGSTEAAHSRQAGIPSGHPIGEIVLICKDDIAAIAATRPVTCRQKKAPPRKPGRVAIRQRTFPDSPS
jgi:hypothetical protein